MTDPCPAPTNAALDERPAPIAARIHAVLCHPQDVRNVGTSIRAAANHGLGGLTVVSLDDYDPEDLFHFSAGATDVIALRFERDLDRALAPFSQILGTSRRSRDGLGPPCWPAAGVTARLTPQGEVALLFGNERTGLTTAEMDRCQALIYIPTDPRKPSLNLGHAVACMGYELARPAGLGLGPPPAAPEPLRAAREAIEGFYSHVEGVAQAIGYPPGRNPELFTRRLRRLLDRANPSAKELAMLAGIFSELRRLQARGPEAQAGPDQPGPDQPGPDQPG